MSRRLTIHPALNRTRKSVNGVAQAFEHSETYSTLLRVVATVTSDRSLQEDLLQEAVIHLWQLNRRRPGQSPSWYFKSCQLHLLNLLRKGRSIDSLKHRKGRTRLLAPAADDSREGADLNELVDHSDPEESVFAQVSARDILTSLCQWLDPPDRLILDHLADGLSAREIASRLQLSHTAVLKRQRKIAAVAVSLGLFPSSNARVCSRKIPLRPLPARPAILKSE
jgi:RNA polymerase sigma factor (sigma-70 family)